LENSTSYEVFSIVKLKTKIWRGNLKERDVLEEYEVEINIEMDLKGTGEVC
jgi:hypothetical protein